jgi:hypothetical protein
MTISSSKFTANQCGSHTRAVLTLRPEECTKLAVEEAIRDTGAVLRLAEANEVPLLKQTERERLVCIL